MRVLKGAIRRNTSLGFRKKRCREDSSHGERAEVGWLIFGVTDYRRLACSPGMCPAASEEGLHEQ